MDLPDYQPGPSQDKINEAWADLARERLALANERKIVERERKTVEKERRYVETMCRRLLTDIQQYRQVLEALDHGVLTPEEARVALAQVVARDEEEARIKFKEWVFRKGGNVITSAFNLTSRIGRVAHVGFTLARTGQRLYPRGPDAVGMSEKMDTETPVIVMNGNEELDWEQDR